jgi:hypothetical protein
MRADPGATPAHHPEIVRAFASASDGMSPRFFALERDGHLCGGMAAVLQRRAGFHWIHAMSALLSGAPLAFPGAGPEVDAACAAGLEALAREVGAVGGAWACYRPEGEPVAPEILARVSGETRTFEAAQVRLARGIGSLLQKMDRKTRKEMRQARERGLEVAEEPGRLTEAYSLYRAQATGWSAHRAVPLELLRRLLAGRDAAGEPVARLFTVRDARGLLAAVLALDGPRETMLWWSGTHPAARAAHAFPLLLWTVAEWAEAHGRDRVNLGASAGRGPLVAFKESLGSVGFTYPVRWLDARHAPAAGRAIAWLQTRIRRGRPRGEPA